MSEKKTTVRVNADRRDVKIARERLREVELDPTKLVRGKELEDELNRRSLFSADATNRAVCEVHNRRVNDKDGTPGVSQRQLPDMTGRLVLWKGKAGVVVTCSDTELAIRLDITATANQSTIQKVDRASPDWRLRFPDDPRRRLPGAGLSSVWVAIKPGEERRYASATPYSREFAAMLLAQGYEIFRLDFELPDGFDSAGAAVLAKPVRDGV